MRRGIAAFTRDNCFFTRYNPSKKLTSLLSIRKKIDKRDFFCVKSVYKSETLKTNYEIKVIEYSKNVLIRTRL